jgi:hypothetical protein
MCGRELQQQRGSMSARNLTLTSIGLPVRAELRLRSLLEVVNAKTTDRWSFVERADAHGNTGVRHRWMAS